MSSVIRKKDHGPLGRETPMNSDTVQAGNPFKGKTHSYDEVNLFKATHVKRYMSKSDVMTYEFTNGTSFDLKVTEKFDRNVYMKLPDEIIKVPVQTRTDCDLHIFWTWKKATGQMTQDMPKVTDVLIPKESKPGPIAQLLLDEQAAKGYTATPLVNPNPLTDEQKADILRQAQEADARVKASVLAAKSDDGTDKADSDAAFKAITAERDNKVSNQSDDWSGFWTSIKNLSTGLDITDHHAYVHAFYEVDSVKDRAKSTMLKELKAHFDKVKVGKEELLSKTAIDAEKQNNAQEAPPSQPTRPTTAPKQNSASTGQNSTVKPAYKKATKKNSKLRLAIGGVPGGGKTYTALQIATEMFPNGKIAVLDTESGSAAKYADAFDFDVLEINDDYRPEKYIDAIHLAESEGYDVLIIDSFSHEWAAAGGILDIVDRWKLDHPTRDGKEDGRAAWGHASPRHNDLVTTILQSNIHIIATMRCKWKTVAARDENKRPISVKVLGDLEQRQKIEYEFDIVALCDQNQDLIIDKTRCTELRGYKGNCAGKEVARKIAKWLNIAA